MKKVKAKAKAKIDALPRVLRGQGDGAHLIRSPMTSFFFGGGRRWSYVGGERSQRTTNEIERETQRQS